MDFTFDLNIKWHFWSIILGLNNLSKIPPRLINIE